MSPIFKLPAIVFTCLMILFFATTPARAQHGDYVLGTVAFDGAAQPPEGFYYQNLWSWYHASGSDFAAIGALKCGRLDRACLSLNVGGSGSLDLFVDQNQIGWTSPYKILGANYGLLVIIPFVYADGSGAASLQPILTFPRRSVSGSTLPSSGESTKAA